MRSSIPSALVSRRLAWFPQRHSQRLARRSRRDASSRGTLMEPREDLVHVDHDCMTLFRILQSRLQPGLRIFASSKALEQRRTVRQFLAAIFVMTLRTTAD